MVRKEMRGNKRKSKLGKGGIDIGQIPLL